MRHNFKIMAVASVLVGASMLAAWPAVAAKPLGLGRASHGDVRPAPYWRWAQGCRGGRYYTFIGGWGCDFYAYPEGRAVRRR